MNLQVKTHISTKMEKTYTKNAKNVTQKEKKCTEKKGSIQDHQNLMKECLLYLSSNKIFCYQNNTGSIKGANRYQTYGFIGSPDILGIFPDGRYLGIEVKTGSARQNKNQKKFQKKIVDNNGIYIIVRSIDDLKWLISHLKNEVHVV